VCQSQRIRKWCSIPFPSQCAYTKWVKLGKMRAMEGGERLRERKRWSEQAGDVLFYSKSITEALTSFVIRETRTTVSLGLRPFYMSECLFFCATHSTLLVMWFCVGGELLSRDEPDRCHSAHVHEWGRCLLGLITTTDQSETCHAWWVSLILCRWIDSSFDFGEPAVIIDTSLCGF